MPTRPADRSTVACSLALAGEMPARAASRLVVSPGCSAIAHSTVARVRPRSAASERGAALRAPAVTVAGSGDHGGRSSPTGKLTQGCGPASSKTGYAEPKSVGTSSSPRPSRRRSPSWPEAMVSSSTGGFQRTRRGWSRWSNRSTPPSVRCRIRLARSTSASRSIRGQYGATSCSYVSSKTSTSSRRKRGSSARRPVQAGIRWTRPAHWPTCSRTRPAGVARTFSHNSWTPPGSTGRRKSSDHPVGGTTSKARRLRGASRASDSRRHASKRARCTLSCNTRRATSSSSIGRGPSATRVRARSSAVKWMRSVTRPSMAVGRVSDQPETRHLRGRGPATLEVHDNGGVPAGPHTATGAVGRPALACVG
ncbi:MULTISPECIES: hypothetical protein [unclassified Streptomyces]|uniref:hypothetical protein n=1 Tax=unclassified Streptomyces TaxID=2593676 RepID=UPI0033F13EF4